MQSVNLGDLVRDSVTGFEGVVTRIIYYIDTTPQAQVESLAKDGRPTEPQWVEVSRLLVLTPGYAARPTK